MTFDEMRTGVLDAWTRYGKKHEIELGEEYSIIKLSEECGEFAQAYLIFKKLCKKAKVKPDEEAKRELAIELSDVIGTAFLAADRLGIDVEQTLKDKWLAAD